MKRVLIVTGLAVLFLVVALGYLVLRTPELPANYGRVETHLYLGDSTRKPLVVAFGGGSGGNDWERNYLKDKRNELLARGFAVLAIGYFKVGQAPRVLDRISLDAISDTILHIASRHPQLDTGRIILLGGSKGGELVLNLASRFSHFKGVIALSTSHVSFPALTIGANTSSWHSEGREVPYVPATFNTIWPALTGDLYGAFSLMLEDKRAVSLAEIAVERINGPILLLSGTKDDQWPSAYMSEQVMNRLANQKFKHTYKHLAFEGGHTEPLNHFDNVLDFLEAEFGK